MTQHVVHNMNHETSIHSLKSRLTGGVTPAMATPVQADGYRVNTAVLPQLVNFLIEAGVKGLFVGGTTGEGILLDDAERRSLHEVTVTAVQGRVPVLLHVGTNRIDSTIALSRHAAEIGADAVVAVTPYFYGVDDDGLLVYYHAIANAAPNTPVLAYDIPQMAANAIQPAFLPRLAREVPTLAGIKTSRPDAQVVRQLIDAAPEHLVVLAGNEAIAVGLLALGAHGLISGASTAVPEPFVALTQAFAQGEITRAQQQQRLINQVLALLPAGARIGAIKQVLSERGIAVGTAVPPRSMPTQPIWPHIQKLL